MAKETENTDIPQFIELTPDLVRRWSEVGGEWYSLPEISNALAQFRGNSATSKRTTILEIVRAELEGRPESSVLGIARSLQPVQLFTANGRRTINLQRFGVTSET